MTTNKVGETGWYKIAIVALCIVVGFLLLRPRLFPDPAIDVIKRYKEQAIKSDSVYRALEDSLQGIIIRTEVVNTYLWGQIDSLKTIETKHDKQISSYRSLPVTDRFRVFSEWLSKADSVRGR